MKESWIAAPYIFLLYITNMLIEDFNQTLGFWIKELDQYSMTQLLAKPSPTSWSIGQLYMHLIHATRYFIQQVQICTSNSDNANEGASTNAKRMFLNNDFPNAILEGPPSNASTPQPVSKEQLATKLINLKDEIRKAEYLITTSQCNGKTKHLGLGYFTACEWMQFAEMHFRHHVRQKKRLDDFLKEKSING